MHSNNVEQQPHNGLGVSAVSDGGRLRVVMEALRETLGDAAATISVAVGGDIATLKGHVLSEAQKAHAERAARSVAGIKEVEDHLVVDERPGRDLFSNLNLAWEPATDLLLIRRFCSLEKSSFLAAIWQAKGALERFAREHGEAPTELRIAYRNLQRDSVTVDVMCRTTRPVTADVGEIGNTRWPQTRYLSFQPRPGIAGMIAAFHSASFQLSKAGFKPPVYWWQTVVLPLTASELPTAPVCVPATDGEQ